MTPYDFECRECSATIGKPCRDERRRQCMVHPSRVHAFRVVADEPLPERGDEDGNETKVAAVTVPVRPKKAPPRTNANIRQERRDMGRCVNGMLHGKPVSGDGMCQRCVDTKAEYRARNRAAKQGVG